MKKVTVKLTLVKAMKAQRESRNRPGTHCTGGFVGPSACLDGCGKSRRPPGFDPRTSIPLRVAVPAALSGPTPWNAIFC